MYTCYSHPILLTGRVAKQSIAEAKVFGQTEARVPLECFESSHRDSAIEAFVRENNRAYWQPIFHSAHVCQANALPRFAVRD